MKLGFVLWNYNGLKGENIMGEEMKNKFGFEVRHVGINCENEEEALKVAEKFELLFGFTKKVGNSSVFAGTGVEVMKTPYLGKNGHIAIGTTDIEGAIEYLQSKGIVFDQATAKYKNEKMIAIYMNEEVGGFAIHLVQK